MAAPALLRSRRASAGQSLRLGLVSPQTGPLAAFGEADGFVLEQIRGVLADGLETRRGRMPVEIIVRDSRSNPNRAAEVAAQLILKDEVDLLLAASTPDTVNPVADQAESYEVPCLTTDCPWQSWFFGRKGDPGKGFAWTYHFFFGFDDAVAAFVDLWSTVDTNRRIGLILPNDADGIAAADVELGVTPVYQRAGFEIVNPGLYTPFAEDYSAAIEAFKRGGVDIVSGLMVPPDFATFWAQAGQQGLRPKVVTVGKAVLFPSAVAAIGERADGLSTEIWWSPHHPFRSGLTGQSAAELAGAFSAATGRPWTQPLGFKHALFEVAADVLRRADDPKDKGAIIEAIRTMDYGSVVGPVHWTGDPMPNVSRTPLVAGQWQRTADRFDLAICANAHAPSIPVTDRLRLLA
ncbi:MAG: ABC transporter substrate-binding protein [Geminicoccaceae bacterium]